MLNNMAQDQLNLTFASKGSPGVWPKPTEKDEVKLKSSSGVPDWKEGDASRSGRQIPTNSKLRGIDAHVSFGAPLVKCPVGGGFELGGV